MKEQVKWVIVEVFGVPIRVNKPTPKFLDSLNSDMLPVENDIIGESIEPVEFKEQIE